MAPSCYGIAEPTSQKLGTARTRCGRGAWRRLRSQVCYWLGREFWGKGIASRALRVFLREVQVRPLYARVAKDNVASLRVLQKCGFEIRGEARGFAHARGEEVEELVLELKPRP